MKKTIFITLFVIFISSFSFANDNVDEMLATYINLKGHLCAKVVNVSPLKLEKSYEVKCIEYRGGQGTVQYIVNMKTGTVVKK